MPIVQHVHVHAEHDAMTKPLNTTGSKLVGKWLLLHTCSVLLRCKCVDASCSYPTAAKPPQLVAHERLCHVDVRT